MISGHIKLVTQWQRNNFKKAKYSSCQLRRELERTKMDNPFQVAYPIHVPSWWSTFSPPSITSPISRTHRNLSGFISSWRFKKKKKKHILLLRSMERGQFNSCCLSSSTMFSRPWDLSPFCAAILIVLALTSACLPTTVVWRFLGSVWPFTQLVQGFT